MVKSFLSGVDLRVLSKELSKLLVNARFDKAYSLVNDCLRLRFHASGVGPRDLIIASNFLCVSTFDYPQLEKPSDFAMALRKHLEGLPVKSVEQHDLDRILELWLEGGRGKFLLIVELFSKGNVVLCDSNRKILGLLNRQKWRDRTLTHGREYLYPPEVENPLTLSSEKFKTALRYSKKGLAASIASLGLGGFYAEEICLNANLDKAIPAESLGEQEAENAYISFKKLVEMIDDGKTNPSIVLDGSGGYIDVTPFEFNLHQGNEKKTFKTFNDAVDEYFSRLQSKEMSTTSGRNLDEALGKLSLIREKQTEALVRLRKDAEKHQKAGDLIYQNLEAIGGIVEQIKKARKQGLSDEEINKKFALGKTIGIREAKIFKNLSKNKMTLDFD